VAAFCLDIPAKTRSCSGLFKVQSVDFLGTNVNFLENLSGLALSSPPVSIGVSDNTRSYTQLSFPILAFDQRARIAFWESFAAVPGSVS